MRRQLAYWPLLASLCLLAPALGTAQSPANASDAAAQLVAQERLRVTVEQAFEQLRAPAGDADQAMHNLVAAVDSLEQAGPGVVPFLIDEINQALPGTFLFSSYALGRLGTEEAKAALRAAIERAEQQQGKFAKTRKAWAAYALGLAGEVDAIRLVNEGRHVVGHYPMHGEMSVIEAAAVQIGPESVPILLKQLDVLGKDETLVIERAHVMRAMGRVGDPAAVPKLIEILQTDPIEPTRREAVRALKQIVSPDVPAALVAALDDEGARVRTSAALALESLQFPSSVEAIIAHLENEESSAVRSPLYSALAALQGPKALATLRKYWPHPDPVDRLFIVRALSQIGSGAETVTLLKQALGDSDLRVDLNARIALSDMATPDALEILIEGVRDARWPSAQTSIELLGNIGATSGAPAMAERLLNVELAGVVVQPSAKPRIALLCETLVTLGYHSAIADLRAAAARQTDAGLVLDIEDAIARLELIAKNGDDVKAWAEASRAAGESVRRLAYRRLAEIGGQSAAAALIERFGRVETEEGVAILEALGRVDTAASAELLRRVLLAPEFDDLERERLRAMAGWSAKRLGGPDMLDALEASFERRDGRDSIIGVYLALAAEKDALPTLTRYRPRFMRYMNALRGKELTRLDAIVGDLRAGRSIARYDVAPPLMPY